PGVVDRGNRIGADLLGFFDHAAEAVVGVGDNGVVGGDRGVVVGGASDEAREAIVLVVELVGSDDGRVAARGAGRRGAWVGGRVGREGGIADEGIGLAVAEDAGGDGAIDRIVLGEDLGVVGIFFDREIAILVVGEDGGSGGNDGTGQRWEAGGNGR